MIVFAPFEHFQQLIADFPALFDCLRKKKIGKRFGDSLLQSLRIFGRLLDRRSNLLHLLLGSSDILNDFANQHLTSAIFTAWRAVKFLFIIAVAVVCKKISVNCIRNDAVFQNGQSSLGILEIV